VAEENEEETGGPRSQMWKHEAMVEWLNEQYGVDLDTLSAAEIIAYAFAKRVEWRRTDIYRNLVNSRAETVEAEKAAKAEERAKAAAERKAAKEAEKAAAKEAAAAEGAKSPAAAKKAAAATKTVTKATKATKSAKKATGDDESPFG
jgi:hypothetical protein